MEKIEARKQEIIKQVESKIPDFADMIKKNNGEAMIIHQDAFCADYDTEELMLLGMAIKYAGMKEGCGDLMIHGKNRSTLT